MSLDSPTPRLPTGAGGPLTRAAGRGPAPVAIVLEPDPLARLLVLPAVAALGFRPVTALGGEPEAERTRAVFVALEGLADCRHARKEAASALLPARAPVASAAAPSAGLSPLVVGYGAGSKLLLSAHRAHGCCDLVLLLDAPAGRPRLLHLPARDAAADAGLSVREADVLVLLLRGLTTPAVAVQLCVSESTVRTHCRAVLRKLGVRDRRALRAWSLGGTPRRMPGAGHPSATLSRRQGRPEPDLGPQSPSAS